jgi:hypothetical protein
MAWFGLGAMGGVVAAYRVFGLLQVAGSDLRGPDFFSFYAAARLLVAWGGTHLYEAPAQQHFQSQVTAAWPGHFILLPYLHPPYYTLLIAPLALLTFRQAYIAMAALNAMLLVVTTVVAGRAEGLGRRGTVILGLLTAAFLPVFVVLVQGQSDLVILLPLYISYLWWKRGRTGWAGVFAGLAVAKPQLVLLVPLLFLARRSWRALAGYGLSAAALVLVSLPAFGFAGWLRYLAVIAPWLGTGDQHFPISGQTVFSLRGLLESAPGGRPVAVVVLALAALAALAVVVARPALPGLDFAFILGVSLVLSPYQNLHDLSLLVLPGVAVVAAAHRGTTRAPAAGLVIALAAYLLIDLATVLGPRSAALAACAVALYLGWATFSGGHPRGSARSSPAM